MQVALNFFKLQYPLLKNKIDLDQLVSVFFFYTMMLIIFANSLDPDQARQNVGDQTRQNVGPDLDPNSFILIVFLKEFFEKNIFANAHHNQRKLMTSHL